MVVTRRAPAPPTPTSRTNSSQPIPRIKSKLPTDGTASSPLVNSATAEDLNGVADTARGQSPKAADLTKKGKSKGRGKQKKKSSRNGSGGFLELLTRAFLLFFTIYTLSVCPTDEHLKSPVCRGLHEYRRLILEPYLLPPFQQALAHPSVAPYIDRAKPYAERFVATAKPIALRTQHEWNARVVPQWNKRIVPQWNKHAVPVWNSYAVPQIQRVEQQLNPYIRTLTTEYEQKIAPHVQLAFYNLQKWRVQAQPYVVLAAQRTYSGYQKAKPYAIPLLQRMKILFAELVQFLIAQRRQFVDPHLVRIWEGVVELSGGKPATPVSNVHKPITRTPAASQTKVAHAVSSVASSSASSAISPSSSALPPLSDSIVSASSSPVLRGAPAPSDTQPVAVTAGSDVHPSQLASDFAVSVTTSSGAVPPAASTASSKIFSSVDVASAAASSSASAVISALTDSAVPSATALVEENAHGSLKSATSEAVLSAASLAETVSASLSSASASAVETVAEAAATVSSLTDQAYSSATSLASSASESVRSAVKPTTSASPGDDDIDMDAFYAELGLNSEDEPLPSQDNFVPPPEETETEEEKAEKERLRQIETAKKRADITGRHTKWEQEIEEAAADGRKVLRKQLVASRKAAVVELKESKEIRKEVESLVEEAEKFLKGAEKYLTNLKREARRPDEKRTMWERVVEKVDAKFGERLMQTEAVINGWYNVVLNVELEEVRKVSQQVREIADRAQTDLGLDYAWLDDVTYQDWQRYHDLVRSADKFLELAMTIQDGSHSSPPINPVLPALADLQAEVQDVVVGFETRLRRVKRNGDRAFGAEDGSNENLDDEETDAPADETVSILPIEQDEKKDPASGQSPPDIPQVVIGRSKEEVVAALNRAAEVDPSATSVPDQKANDPEAVVESLASEVEKEAAAFVTQHEEL
ncbi:hypothetical protein EIP91_003130 [Steccherinum ochraceum]|uniref:Uncharacterized protein n=1 Tax=Steccherinum ochraceum TaxID=92696 RepID=A0A4V2MXX5_9APHY|nr:hypothetical protein EIP91_003130 [Steccherinum ochraceum]